MSNPNYITRKEIASLLEASVDVVRKNEKRWGIYACRCDLNERNVRYWRKRTMELLRQCGHVE